MALEHPTLNIVNELPEKMHKIDNETLDFVFGKQDSHDSKPNDIEMINNEKNHPNHNDQKGTDNTTHPLLNRERDQQKPPLAGSEIDDLDGDTVANGGSYHGIDDGLLDANDNKPPILVVGDDLDDDQTEPEMRDDGVNTEEDGKWPWMGGDEPDYPYDNHLTPRFGLDDRPTSPIPSTIIDVNTYQQKKNLAQGMMDLALLSANANQLRYVLESATSHPYFYPSLVFISLSIIFQIAVGVGLILNSRYDVNDKKEICKADKINNFTVLGIFLITIVNVFITSFSVATPTVAVVQPGGAIIQQAGS